MTDDAASRLLHELVDLPPAELATRLRDLDTPGLNWLGLAEVAAMRALPLDPADADATLPWARVAEIAYGRLEANAANEAERDRHAQAMARLRADLIMRYGPRAGDPYLDCDRVIEWFLRRHAGDLDAAEGDAGHWRDLPIERIRELRELKNDLGIVARLERCPQLSPEIRRWLGLRSRLP